MQPSSADPRPLVSVMMPAYNAGRYIQLAIDSLLRQTYTHWELLLVDDGSQDDTPAVIAGYHDPRIKPTHQENGGESAARNAALSRMNGEILAFLDADDLYLPEHLQTVVDYLLTHPEYEGVYTDGVYINPDGEHLKPLSSRRRGPFQGDIFEQMVRASDVFGTPVCVALRSQLVRRYRLDFDPQIVIGPDWDFLTRYAQYGRFGYTSKTTCLYRVHPDNISLSTGLHKRRESLTLCREKAIKMERFGECSLPVRVFIFFDLLVNLLDGYPLRQTEVSAWPEFQNLPAQERGRLFRLMASKALGQGRSEADIRLWLEQARRLDPHDVRGALLLDLYRLSPWLCSLFLKLRGKPSPGGMQASPFDDLG